MFGPSFFFLGGGAWHLMLHPDSHCHIVCHTRTGEVGLLSGDFLVVPIR